MKEKNKLRKRGAGEGSVSAVWTGGLYAGLP